MCFISICQRFILLYIDICLSIRDIMISNCCLKFSVIVVAVGLMQCDCNLDLRRKRDSDNCENCKKSLCYKETLHTHIKLLEISCSLVLVSSSLACITRCHARLVRKVLPQQEPRSKGMLELQKFQNLAQLSSQGLLH